ncbi:MAG: hypothetical protein AB1898_32240, partial [Acidobacteriota bacterium]
MSTLKLPNYLSSHRKRLGLTQQDELAFLLCLHDGSKVCRYERFLQQPGLRILFAYEIVFRTPAQELFGGPTKETVSKWRFEPVSAPSRQRGHVFFHFGFSGTPRECNPNTVVAVDLETPRLIVTVDPRPPF